MRRKYCKHWDKEYVHNVFWAQCNDRIAYLQYIFLQFMCIPYFKTNPTWIIWDHFAISIHAYVTLFLVYSILFRFMRDLYVNVYVIEFSVYLNVMVDIQGAWE